MSEKMSLNTEGQTGAVRTKADIKREAEPLNRKIAKLREDWRTFMWSEEAFESTAGDSAVFNKRKASYEAAVDKLDEQINKLDHEYHRTKR